MHKDTATFQDKDFITDRAEVTVLKGANDLAVKIGVYEDMGTKSRKIDVHLTKEEGLRLAKHIINQVTKMDVELVYIPQNLIKLLEQIAMLKGVEIPVAAGFVLAGFTDKSTVDHYTQELIRISSGAEFVRKD